MHMSASNHLQHPHTATSQVPISQLHSTLETYLRGQGRQIEKSAGDGNCLFRSLSFQLTGKQDEHISVRTLTVRFENLNRSSFQPYLTPINCPTMAEHIEHVQRPGVFGTHLEILAIATYYAIPVYYCQKTRDQYSRHCVNPIINTGSGHRLPDLAGCPLEQVQPPSHFELSYTLNTHYDSIVTVSGDLCIDLPPLNEEEVYVPDIL